MEGAEIMRGDIELVTDILAYEDAMRRREISQMYREIACLQQKLKYLNTDQNAIERRRPCSRRFGFSTRWEEQVDVNSSSSSSDSEEDEYDYEDFFIASKDTLCEPTAEELEAVSLVPSLDSIKSRPTGSLIHGLNRDIGIYFCKHCENSWPCSFFRNTQQFGAHCSNCSRQRKVKHPHDLNSEAPKPRSPTPMDLSKGAASPKRSLKNKPSAKREIQKKRKRTKKESPMSLGSSSSSSVRKPKHGCDKERGIYYCKHCESSWPMDYFRNPQQFGAHCSNCSRQRQVRDPRTSDDSPKPAKIHRKEMLHHDDSDSQSTDSLMSEGATSEIYSDGAAPLSAINPFVDDLFGESALFH